MKYFAEFDANGFRVAGHIADGMPYTEEDIHELFPNAIEISEEDQALYLTGEYYRGPDGTPVKIIVNDPTQDELKKQALDILNAEYAEKLAIIARDYNKPSLLLTPGDPQIAINQAAIAAEYKAVADELFIKQGVIKNG